MSRVLALTIAVLAITLTALPAQAWILGNCTADNGISRNGITRNGVDTSGVTMVAIELPRESE